MRGHEAPAREGWGAHETGTHPAGRPGHAGARRADARDHGHRRPRGVVHRAARWPLPQRPRVRAGRERPARVTWDAEDWYLYGCVPTSTAPLSSDPQGASGMSVSNLWNRASNPQRGRDDVTVALRRGRRQLADPHQLRAEGPRQLNTGELPYPENAEGRPSRPDAHGQTFANTNPYDLNNDGVVNVEDYVNDPRVLAGRPRPAEEPAAGGPPSSTTSAPPSVPASTATSPPRTSSSRSVTARSAAAPSGRPAAQPMATSTTTTTATPTTSTAGTSTATTTTRRPSRACTRTSTASQRRPSARATTATATSAVPAVPVRPHQGRR